MAHTPEHAENTGFSEQAEHIQLSQCLTEQVEHILIYSCGTSETHIYNKFKWASGTHINTPRDISMFYWISGAYIHTQLVIHCTQPHRRSPNNNDTEAIRHAAEY